MSTDALMFWILVFPVLLVAAAYYLGFLTVGTGFIVAALKSARKGKGLGLAILGLAVIAAPFAWNMLQTGLAERDADARYEALAQLDRVNLKGQMPRHYLTVGNFSASDRRFIQSRFALNPLPKAEQDRMRSAYRNYRKAEFCHKHFGGQTVPGTKLSTCKRLPESLQAALQLKHPMLVFAEGSSTKLRQSNTFVGDIYEIRLVTRNQDLLVDYYEERMVRDASSLINPFSSGWRRGSSEDGLTRQDFIQTALERAMQ